MTFATDLQRWGKNPAEKSQIRLHCSEKRWAPGGAVHPTTKLH